MVEVFSIISKELGINVWLTVALAIGILLMAAYTGSVLTWWKNRETHRTQEFSEHVLVQRTGIRRINGLDTMIIRGIEGESVCNYKIKLAQ